MKPLAEAGYRWIFLFKQNENFPNAILISWATGYNFETELADNTTAYNVVIVPSQIVYTNITVGDSDNLSAEQANFYKHMQLLLDTLNNYADSYAKKGLNSVLIPLTALEKNGLNLMSFLYHTEDAHFLACGSGSQPDYFKTLNLTQTNGVYNSSELVDFAIYRDTAKTIKFTDSWISTIQDSSNNDAAVPFNSIIQWLSSNNTSNYYYCRVSWTAQNKYEGIYLSWNEQGQIKIDALANGQNEAIAEKIAATTANIAIIPPVYTEYVSSVHQKNQEYIKSLLTQIQSGLKTSMVSGVRYCEVLWATIDPKNESYVRQFWNSNKTWSGSFTSIDNHSITGTTCTLEEALQNILKAKSFATYVDLVTNKNLLTSETGDAQRDAAYIDRAFKNIGYQLSGSGNTTGEHHYIYRPLYYVEQSTTSTRTIDNTKQSYVSIKDGNENNMCGIVIGYCPNNNATAEQNILNDLRAVVYNYGANKKTPTAT